MRLSQRRAQSAVDYIIEASGLSATRIVARGYGETNPIARNTNPDGTDNVEGRAKNMRTEFKVLSINPNEQEGPDEERFFEEGDVIDNTTKKKKNNNWL